MNVVLVNTFFPSHRGGLEIVAGRIAADLASRGVKVHWFASACTEPPVLCGVTTTPVPAWNWLEQNLGIPYPIWTPGVVKALSRAIRNADVVHIHDCLYFSSVLAFVVAKIHRVPVVFTQHIDLIPYRSWLPRTLMRLATLATSVMLSQAQRTVFIGAKTRDYFCKLRKFARPPLLILNGVDKQLFRVSSSDSRSAFRKKLGIAEDAKVCLFVGRFVDKKGLPLLAQLAERTPDLIWCFAGWGPVQPTLWKLSNVICAGSVPHASLAEYYKAADILVLPSLGEGFPLVVQESMACGTPCLITPDTARGLENPPSCLLTAPLSVAEFENALRRFFLDPQKRISFRDEVASFASQNWDWELVVEQYTELFRLVSTLKPKEVTSGLVRKAG